MNRNATELLRLRAEATRLRNELKSALASARKDARPAGVATGIEQTFTSAPLTETYSAKARAVVAWDQACLAGGWKTSADKSTFILACPKRMDDPAAVLIEAKVVEISDAAAAKLGLQNFFTDEKTSQLSSPLNGEMRDSLLKAASETNGVAILDAPRLAVQNGLQAQIASKTKKETSEGVHYTIGPALTFRPTIAADGQSVELALEADLTLPTPAR